MSKIQEMRNDFRFRRAPRRTIQKNKIDSGVLEQIEAQKRGLAGAVTLAEKLGTLLSLMRFGKDPAVWNGEFLRNTRSQSLKLRTLTPVGIVPLSLI